MKRVLTLLCALTLLLLAFAACHEPTTDPSVTDQPTASATDAPTAPDTPAASETDGTTDAPTDTETDTEAPDDPPPEAGTVRFYDPTAIRKLKKAGLSVKSGTDDAEGEYITLAPRKPDPQLLLASTAAEAVEGARFLRIRYRTSTPIAGRLYLGETQISEAGSMPITYITDGEWHTLELDLYRSSTYASSLAAIRYDPMDGTDPDGESIDIAWIGFYPYFEDDPTADLPDLPEDAPDLSDYEQPEQSDGRPTYYRASNYLTAEKGVYTFKDGFTLDLYRRGYFNRYTISYSSTSPLKGEITYLMWDENGERMEKTETFFLEAGHKVFDSLIDDYDRSKYAWGMDRITLSTCDGSTATFELTTLADTIWDVYPGTYYLENDRYKLGVLLTWGGGISYIEDKQDGDDSLGNLINRADPGRLVQQSYYGVHDGPYYTGAYYGETLWGYNPVQGGDLYGNGSKLVDVRISDDGTSMYIKCRPLDWAHNNSPTPSYMENTYTLTPNGIRVENRFVDFFGVEHPARHAELPAFYTVSHLGTFHYYNGTKPWTGDAYETLPNEPFWAGNGDAYHTIKKGNTETWAAWTNTDGYGIGLYVPGTEIMLAGRHEYNGSKDPANGGTSYVAPLRTMAIVSFVPFEYEYFISTGTVGEMRTAFKTYAEAQDLM